MQRTASSLNPIGKVMEWFDNRSGDFPEDIGNLLIDAPVAY